MRKRRKHRIRNRNVPDLIAQLAEIDREIGAQLTPPGKGVDLRPREDEDPFFKKLMEEERCFLNPEEWGIDLRPVFNEQLDPPASPDGLTDREVGALLRWMVLLLAQHHCCLVSTNHLSDRQLYRHIMEEILPRPIGVGPNPIGGILYHECCGYDDDDYLRYYADDRMREEFREFHDGPLPDKAPLVSDRDIWLETLAEAHRHLPLPDYAKEGKDAGA